MKDLFRHFFIPRQSNNYRAKLLHHETLLLFIFFFILTTFLFNIIKINFPSVLGIATDISSQKLLLLANQKRQENKLPPLSLNPELSLAARNKADDMFSKDYWAHNSPDGKTPWIFIEDAGYNYVYAGENLARGFNTDTDVTNAWMASPSHRANILSPNYTDVGFAVITGKLNGEETVLVVEEFGGRTLAAVPLQPPSEKAISTSATVTEKSSVGTLGKEVFSVSPSIKEQPFINSLSFTSRTDMLIIFLFIAVFLVDMIIIERRKITRFVGHNTDHIFYLIAVLFILIILSKGALL